jgi:glutaredoxin-related protein
MICSNLVFRRVYPASGCDIILQMHQSGELKELLAEVKQAPTE